MHRAIDVIQWFEVAALLGIATASYRLWRRRRSPAAGWFSVTFVAGLFVAATGPVVRLVDAPPAGPEVRPVLVLLALFPYLFLRAALSFAPRSVVLHRTALGVALALGLSLAALPHLPQPGEARSATVLGLTLGLVLTWAVLSAVSVVRLWHAGRAQPTVSRRRMRMLAIGGATLTAAILLSAVPSSARPSAVSLTVALVELASLITFFLAFTTPAVIRVLWREHDMNAFRAAQADLIRAITVADVCRLIVPHAVALVGGRGAVVGDAEGNAIAWHGLDAPEAVELLHLVSTVGVSGQSGTEPAPGVLAVELTAAGRSTGLLVVRASPQSPFFRDDEVRVLAALGQSVDVAIERARLLDNERAVARELSTSRAALAHAQHLARLGSWVWDVARGRVQASEEMYRLYGLEARAEEDGPERLMAVQHPEDVAGFRRVLKETVASGRPFAVDHRIILPDGTLRWMHSRGGPAPDATGAVVSLQGTTQDITDAKLSGMELAARARQQTAVARLGQRVIDGSDLGVLLDEAALVVADNVGTEMAAVLELSPSGDVLVRAGVGLSPGTVGRVLPAGTGGDPLLPDRLREEHGVRAWLSAPVAGDGTAQGAIVALTTREHGFAGHDGDFLRSVANLLAGMMRRHRAEELLAHRALHDPLTGLPNWVLVSDRLAQALQRAKRAHRSVAVLTLDLDRFAVVNHELGHRAGDELLVQAAARIEGVLGPTDTLGRQGNDEFMVVAEDVSGEEGAAELARRLSQALERPFAIAAQQVLMTASIGVAVSPEGRHVPETLMGNATAALQLAKRRGRGHFQMYVPELRGRTRGVLSSESQLRVAIDNGELRLHYQPEVRLQDGRVTGAEVLVRWQHPVRGLVEPAEFLALAEDTGLVVPMGSWVLTETCRQTRRWRSSHPALAGLTMWVNLSARQFAEPGLVDLVEGVLSETGTDPRTLGIEITESVLMDDADSVDATLTALRDLGVRLAVDDFGTGFSSLAYLRRFAVDVLKVDRSFVAGMDTPGDGGAIVAAVVEMAHALGLSATAEGVESLDQVRALRELGCDSGQGFWFARPQPPDVFAKTAGARLSLPVPLPSLSSLSGGPDAVDLRGVTILVCDDDPVARRVFRASLESAGATVMEADGGDTAAAIASARAPDLVLLDLFMPFRDGVSTFAEIRRRSPRSKVAFVSAYPLADVAAMTADPALAGCFAKHEAVGRLPELVTGCVAGAASRR